MASWDKDLYHSPPVRKPTRQEVQEIAEEFGLRLAEDDLTAYHEALVGAVGAYEVLDKYVEPKPPVKYPRTPGYVPDKKDNPYNAWYVKCEIAGAEGGKLSGKRVAIKDTIAVAGVPLMCGSRLMEGYVPEFDASVVTRILDQGGTICGKAATEDMCFDGSSFTCCTGPILNFHDRTRSAGGSSAGCAVLLAAGEVDMAVGGDQAGSVRMPAAWSGVVGLKPTFGLVPYTGTMACEPVTDYLGPMARSVKDCALLLEVIAGYDNGLDARQRPDLNIPNYSEQLTERLDGVRVGLLQEGFQGVDEEVADIVRQAATRLEQVGATVEEVSVPAHPDALALWCIVNLEGTHHTLFAARGINFGSRSFYPSSMVDYLSTRMRTRPKDMCVNPVFAYLMGEYMQKNYSNRYYMKGQNVTRVVTAEYDAVLRRYDVLVLPTMKTTAHKLPPRDISTAEYLRNIWGMIDNTAPFSLTGHPALSVNAAFSASGLPVGMMVVGRHYDETTVLRVGHVHERLSNGESSNM